MLSISLLLILLTLILYLIYNKTVIEPFQFIPKKTPEPEPVRRSIPKSNNHQFDFLNYSFFKNENNMERERHSANMIVSNHPCNVILHLNNPLLNEQKKKHQLTLMAELKVKNIDINNNNWFKLFHHGNRDSTIRSPGLFLHLGHLVLTISTNQEWNVVVWKSTFPIENQKSYQIVIELSDKNLSVYLDQMLQHTQILTETPIIDGDIWIGRHPKEQDGANIDITLYSVSGLVMKDNLRKCRTVSQYLSIYGE